MTIMQNQKDRDPGRGTSTGKSPIDDPETSSKQDEAWIDPVCGKNVRKQSAFFTGQHADRTYRFCSEACRSAFEKDPQRFTKASSPSSPTTESDAE